MSNDEITGKTKKTKRRRTIFIVVALVIVIVGMGVFAIVMGYRAVMRSGITQGPDAMFGDQHLKTSVALIELHKIRYGEYPSSLKDLKFIGQWDQIHLQSVRYYPSDDRMSYYIEVTRGWMGNPELEMPDEFWQGTGYNKNLKAMDY